MATQTPNYNLIKDDPNENYDIDKLNANLDKIDTGMKATDTIATGNKTLIGTITELLTTTKTNLVAAINEIFSDLETHKDDFESHEINDTTTHNGKIGKVRYNDRFYDAVIGNPFYDVSNKKSLAYGETAANIVDIGDSFIVGSTGTGTVLKKYNKNTLLVIASSVEKYQAYDMVADETYLYIGANSSGGIYTGQGIYKVNKTTFEVVAFVSTSASQAKNIQVDDNYLYLTFGTGNTIRKYNKNNLSFVAESGILATGIRTLCLDGEFIYVGGGGIAQSVQKVNKGTLQIVGATPSFGGIIQKIISDDNYLYVAGETALTVNKYNKNDLTLASSSPVFTSSNTNRLLALDGDYVYLFIGGGACIYEKTNMSILENITSTGTPVQMVYSNSVIYTVSASSGNNINIYDVLNKINGARRII